MRRRRHHHAAVQRLRVSLGLAVFAGMLASAILGTLMVPACFAFIQRIRLAVKGQPIPADNAESEPSSANP